MACEWGVAKVIKFIDEKKAILIKSPAFIETAERKRELLMEEGYDVMTLNTGIEEEAALADELLEKYCFQQ
jgi:hypothetical protein